MLPKTPMDETYDVIIVGAGVCGALVAWRLAEDGARVLVLEAGPEIEDRLALVKRFAEAPAKIPSAPYEDEIGQAHAPSPRVTDKSGEGHYTQETSRTPLKSTYQRLVGGSTWHWLGNTPRFLPNDFRTGSLYGFGVDWPLTYDELEPWYTEAERQMGVSGDHQEWDGVGGAWRSEPFPMTRVWPAYGDRWAVEALDGQQVEGAEIAVRVTPQARNSRPYQGRPPCAGNSSCVPICPIEAKYDATVHIRLARAARVPAVVQSRSVVRALVPGGNGSIDHVVYDRWSPDGQTREQHTARAARYVIAAHAIETPLLLLTSGLARSGPVGLYLMDHLQGYGGAILPNPAYPFRGPPVTSGIDAFRDGDFRRLHSAFRISVGNDGWGRMEPLEKTVGSLIDAGYLGEDLRRAVNHRVTRMVRFSFSTEMQPDPANRVTLNGRDARGNPRPSLHFAFPEYNLRAFDFANGVLGRFFDLLGVPGNDRRFTFDPTSPVYSGAGHIMGTCRMGTTASNSVVSRDGRAHDHPNLFLVGASVFPTSGTANPTLTAAALALRTADVLSRDL